MTNPTQKQRRVLASAKFATSRAESKYDGNREDFCRDQLRLSFPLVDLGRPNGRPTLLAGSRRAKEAAVSPSGAIQRLPFLDT